mmetsp:Transcript_4228/g.5466  ORF Transcript_4228/g.5466 Transcript_4228/m.5466 type:complete len:178 (+) Transcript_4228:101-634(+)
MGCCSSKSAHSKPSGQEGQRLEENQGQVEFHESPIHDISTLLPVELLQDKVGNTASLDDLKGKVIGLYFSARWCPPCKGFTPKLAEFYNALQSESKNFEVVFISSDRTKEEFNNYFEEMPWLALPFDSRPKKDELSKKFGVVGIPTLVLLDETGKEITRNGRQKIMEDPKGKGFPWQ